MHTPSLGEDLSSLLTKNDDVAAAVISTRATLDDLVGNELVDEARGTASAYTPTLGDFRWPDASFASFIQQQPPTAPTKSSAGKPTYETSATRPESGSTLFAMKQLPELLLTTLASILILSACGSSDADASAEQTDTEAEVEETETEETEAETEQAEAGDTTDEPAESTGSEQVEINLIDELDGILNGYCLDIAGGNESVDPANGLQAHTCYSYDGDLGTDQVFETAEFTNNSLYMPVYDVCAEVASLAAGSAIGLNSCDESELQTLLFDADGTIRPTADTTLCFTAGAESRTGRSGDHQIRDLSLETCSDDLASLQQWSSRTGL